MQNLVLAFGSIACLALPALFGFIPLWMAVALHEGTTLLVALNCLRLALMYRASGCVSDRIRCCSCSCKLCRTQVMVN